MKPRLALLLALAACAAASAQETRSTINGTVIDPQGAAVAGAKVAVANLDTNTSNHATSNETGYYEVRLLMPGNYEVSAELQGFKKTVRKGITLSVATEARIDLTLELGGVTEVVSVTADAPLLEIAAAAEGGLMDAQAISELPVLGNNALLLTRLVTGVQTDGDNNYLGLHSISGGSNYYSAGKVGGNEWSIDGTPNQGGSRQAAYLPHSDTVQEFRVESSGFDVSRGRGTGLSVNVISKAGSNQYHGSLSQQHWQQRFNGTPFFVKQLYYRGINEAEAAGNRALAGQLRNSPRQPSGHSNIYAATIGGPVIIPKVYNGKSRMFSLFSFNGYIDAKTEDPNNINFTIPSMANRKGDFSQLLQADAVKYQVYDPLTVRRDTSRSGTHYLRTPFAGNILPASRMINPTYNAYVKFLPVPNNEPGNPKFEPINNYLAVGTPYNWNYKAFAHRLDFVQSERSRFFLRWSYNNFLEDRNDWTYETYRGLSTGGLNRQNRAVTLDWTVTPGTATVLDISVAANQYRSGSITPVPLSFLPSDVGYPKYMDALAGDPHTLPQVRFSGYQKIGQDRVPAYTNFSMLSFKFDASQVRGSHTLRAGADTRQHYRTGAGSPSYGTSGRFEFENYYTRCCDDTVLYTPGTMGLSWASFYLGLPRYMRISTSNASYAMHSPYYGGYLQDNWRIARKLSLNFGFRLEYELGPTERYNRMAGYWDPNMKVPFADLAQAAYAPRAVPALAAADFKIGGGTVFPGIAGAGRRMIQSEPMWMPRAAFAYQIDARTVLRGGFGTFYDTLNTLNYSPSQKGYTRDTSTSVDSNYGTTWRVGDPAGGVSMLTDPFPLRADGTRILQPLLPASPDDASIAFAGQSFDDFYAYDTNRARVHRWRLALQRQVKRSMVFEMAYTGAYGDKVYIDGSYQQNINALPKQYWGSGLVRAAAGGLSSNIPNPFNIANLEPLKDSNPIVYNELSAIAWYTDANRTLNQLLRPFPHMNTSMTIANQSTGKMKSAALEFQFQRRFTKGLTVNAGYVRMLQNKTADWYACNCDAEPSWRLSNNGRPHRFTATGVYQLPFGKRRSMLKRGIFSHLLGGLQAAGTYEFQPGPLLTFGNVFYYGDMKTLKPDLAASAKTLDRWFNAITVAEWYARNRPGVNPCAVDSSSARIMERAPGMGFESCAAYAPDSSYNLRTFPNRVEGLRADGTNQINVNLQREFRVAERARMTFRVDALNIANRSRFQPPTVDPASTNFGRVTEQTAALNRFFQAQVRITF